MFALFWNNAIKWVARKIFARYLMPLSTDATLIKSVYTNKKAIFFYLVALVHQILIILINHRNGVEKKDKDNFQCILLNNV